MDKSKTTVADAKKALKRLDGATPIVCEIDGEVKGLWLNKRTTVGRVLELLDGFDGKAAMTLAYKQL